MTHVASRGPWMTPNNHSRSDQRAVARLGIDTHDGGRRSGTATTAVVARCVYLACLQRSSSCFRMWASRTSTCSLMALGLCPPSPRIKSPMWTVSFGPPWCQVVRLALSGPGYGRLPELSIEARRPGELEQFLLHVPLRATSSSTDCTNAPHSSVRPDEATVGWLGEPARGPRVVTRVDAPHHRRAACGVP
jgi:hypothetical protein